MAEMSVAGSPASSLAVGALKRFIDDNEIKIQAEVNLNKLWESIVSASDEILKMNGWIVNCTMETVQFYVYNSDDWVRLIPAQRVDAQPGETVEVHGGIFQRKHENMVVYKDNIQCEEKSFTLLEWFGYVCSSTEIPINDGMF